MEAKDLRRENDLTEERKRTGEAERRWRAEVDLQVWRRPYLIHTTTHNAHTTHTTHGGCMPHPPVKADPLSPSFN